MGSGEIRSGSAVGMERLALRRLYRWAFLIRAVAGILAYGLTIYLDLPIVEDARYYEETGYEVSREWLRGGDVEFAVFGQGAETGRLLVTVIAIFYYLTNGVRALPLLLVAYSAITAFVPVYVYWFARELHASEAAARRAGWLVALSPAFVFWSGSLYKEGLTLLLLSVIAYHTLRLQSGWQGRSVIILALCVAALWGVRYYLVIAVTLAAGLSLLWARARSARSRSSGAPVFLRQAAIAAAFVAVVLIVGVNARADHVLVENDEGVLVELDLRRAGSAREARSGYLQNASIATPEEALQYFPLGLFYFLTVPLPWQLGSYRQNLIIPENAFWLALYPLMVVGISRAFRSNLPGTLFLLMMTAALCAIYALLSANVGTTYRMRSQVWLLLAPFAAWGWEEWRERRRRKWRVQTTDRAARIARAGTR